MGGVTMSKQVLSVEQMQHLQELGLELKPTMCYHTRIKCEEEWDLVTVIELSEEMWQQIPAYTLHDILDTLPQQARTSLAWNFMVNPAINPNIIDDAYGLLCWAIENGYVETNKAKE